MSMLLRTSIADPAMPDATIDRIKHKMAGDFVCAYRIAVGADVTR